ncbi:hypothetical protein [Pseudomonas sp. H3_G09]
MFRRLREQARSHRDFGGAEDGGFAPDYCGSGLARESAVSGDDDVECAEAFASKPAPTGILVALKIVDLSRIIVGAGLLAKAVGQAAMMLNVCRRLREQARSHRDFGCDDDCRFVPYQCGSEPARESGLSGDDDAECAAAFASKPAPTGILVAMMIVDLSRISVGASLLAKAGCQAMMMLNVPRPSRAGSLPQGFWLR